MTLPRARDESMVRGSSGIFVLEVDSKSCLALARISDAERGYFEWPFRFMVLSSVGYGHYLHLGYC